MDVSDIFNFFSAREGQGGVRVAVGGGGGGVRFLFKIPGEGGGFRGGAEGPGGCLQRNWGIEFWGGRG